METVVLEQLRRQGMTLAAAETLTGGILSARMSAADPAMEVFRGARVAAEAWKRGRADAGAARGDAAAQARARVRHPCRARGHRCRMPAEDMKPGTVSLGADIDGTAHAENLVLPPDRKRMREFSVISLLNLLRRQLG